MRAGEVRAKEVRMWKVRAGEVRARKLSLLLEVFCTALFLVPSLPWA